MESSTRQFWPCKKIQYFYRNYCFFYRITSVFKHQSTSIYIGVEETLHFSVVCICRAFFSQQLRVLLCSNAAFAFFLCFLWSSVIFGCLSNHAIYLSFELLHLQQLNWAIKGRQSSVNVRVLYSHCHFFCYQLFCCFHLFISDLHI